MLRMMLAVFAWPMVVALVASAVLWYRAEFPEPPVDQLLDPIQLRAARETADRALGRLRDLPSAEQEAVLQRLRVALERPGEWVDGLDAAGYRILCLGEQHEPATRRFLAETVFARYAVDRLLIEATPDDLARIERWMAADRDYVPLLDADIAAILDTVRARNPAVVVRGIEETRAQARSRIGTEGSRDRSLVRNFWRAWQPGQRNVILYGALHCADEGTWLYRLLREQLPPREDVPTRNVRVLGTEQHQPTRAFVWFLQGVGLGHGDFVVRDMAALPSQLEHWFPFFHDEVLARYQTLAVFHNAPREIASSERARGQASPVSKPPGSADLLPQWVPTQAGDD